MRLQGISNITPHTTWLKAIAFVSPPSRRAWQPSGHPNVVTLIEADIYDNHELDHDYSYRLPTEVEREYSCRAGTTGDYAGNLDEMAWYEANSQGTMQEAAQKQPNAFGLYDMHGSVEEWCQDRLDSSYYKKSQAVDPQGPETGEIRIIRGGAFSYDAGQLRSAARAGETKSRTMSYEAFASLPCLESAKRCAQGWDL